MSDDKFASDNYRSSFSAPQKPKHDGANFTCQRCYQKGHYTYECKSADVIYRARPTATARTMERHNSYGASAGAAAAAAGEPAVRNASLPPSLIRQQVRKHR